MRTFIKKEYIEVMCYYKRENLRKVSYCFSLMILKLILNFGKNV